MSAPTTTPRRPGRPILVRPLSAGLLLLGLFTFSQSLGWRGTRFPGFFLMPNRVVPSAGLNDWSGVREGRPLYQQVLLAVDDVPVATAEEAYGRAAAHRVGEPVRYLFAREAGSETRTFPLRAFTDGQYLAIFGMYFAGGLAYLLLAFLAGERWEESGLYRGLAAFGWAAAAFAFTALDLYGPGQMFRLHALAEACLPAAAAHLALVCPRDLGTPRPRRLLLTYGLALALAATYELFLYEPRAYSAIHNSCQALLGAAVIAFVSLLALAPGAAPPELGQDGVRRLLAGALVGIVMPATVLAISGVNGGVVPVHVIAWVGFLFPLAGITTVSRRLGARLPAALASEKG